MFLDDYRLHEGDDCACCYEQKCRWRGVIPTIIAVAVVIVMVVTSVAVWA